MNLVRLTAWDEDIWVNRERVTMVREHILVDSDGTRISRVTISFGEDSVRVDTPLEEVIAALVGQGG